MKFTTEFKVPESAQSRRDYIPEKRHLAELKMGNMLAESFGWQNPVNHDLDHHRLEIEAFPIDKWVEFKKEVLAEFEGSYIDEEKILNIFNKLESHG